MHRRSGRPAVFPFQGIADGIHQIPDAGKAERLYIVTPEYMCGGRVVVGRIPPDRHADGGIALEAEHRRLHVAVYARLRAQPGKTPDVRLLCLGRNAENLRYLKTIAHQRQCQLERIGIGYLADGEGQRRMRLLQTADRLVRRTGSTFHRSARLGKIHAESLSERKILPAHGIRLIKTRQRNVRDAEPVGQLVRRRHGFLIEHEIEIRFRHGLKFFHIKTAGNLADVLHTDLLQHRI